MVRSYAVTQGSEVIGGRKMETTNRKRLWIYIAAAYGITAVMTIFMAIGKGRGVDLTTFVNTQMMYPACGVILGKLIARKEGEKLPLGLYITTLITTGVMMLLALMSIIIPMDMAGTQMDIWNLMSQLAIVIASVIAYVFTWTCSKDSGSLNGLNRNNIKWSVILVSVFTVLTFVRIIIPDLILGNGIQPLTEALSQSMTLVTLLVLPINFFMTWIAFFGEEYGWRYYLQPVMQNKFGNRIGVLLLGLVWAIWHIGADFMYYTTTDGPQMFVEQIIGCVAFAIFFGYAYMKTNNLWVPVILHYINNNVAVALAGGSAQDQHLAWSDLPVLLVALLPIILFILMPVFNKKSDSNNSLIE